MRVFDSQTLDEALQIIDTLHPSVIIANKDVDPMLEISLHKIIDESETYDPEVLLFINR